MIKIICTSHGPLATAIIESAGMLFGVSEHVCAITLAVEDTIDEFTNRLQTAVNDSQYDEILILADIPGGTPSNQSMRLAATNKKIHVLSGLNLIMLLEAMIQCENVPAQELLVKLQLSAKNSIQEMKVSANNQVDELDQLLD